MGSQHHLVSLFVVILCFRAASLEAQAESRRLYIVYLGEKQHEDPEQVVASHHDILQSILGSKEEALNSILYSYKHAFSGFAAMLTQSQAREIAELPKVISVKLNQMHHLHTTRSWDFLGLDYNQPTGLLKKANYGEGLIIGVIDTGIWPESDSFSDSGYDPVPSRWKGTCQVGQEFDATNCNRKIIGARWYTGGVDQEVLKGEYMSARDFSGHGTHTASTAAGNLVQNVSYHGLAVGTARGGAPRARIAVYKVCWGARGNCSTAAIVKAIDDAINDGVDVLSLSLGGQEEIFVTLHVVAKGIPVIFAAGNDGPAPHTVVNILPWVTTVAASTIDRSFPTVITLGNNHTLVGQSLFYKIKKEDHFTELYLGGSCDVPSLNTTDIAEKIVFCYAPGLVTLALPRNDIFIPISAVQKLGAKGVIFAQYTTNTLFAVQQCGEVPCVLVDFEIANIILEYMTTASEENNTMVAKVSLARNMIGSEVLSPKIATFSSRGPSKSFPEFLKPDIAAPGVSILAAKRSSYVFDSGTSMACPHVSGIVALLKALHPDWSPSAIKSALVTTASASDGYGLPILANGTPTKTADPFDFGGGFVNPDKAVDPGLVYDIEIKDYNNLYDCYKIGSYNDCEEDANNLNLPSISIPNLKTSVTVRRRVTNVGQVDVAYKAFIKSPPGVEVSVEPSLLAFKEGKKMQSFNVTFKAARKLQGDYMFGSLTWFDGATHSVRIPLAVRTIVEEFYADTS